MNDDKLTQLIQEIDLPEVISWVKESPEVYLFVLKGKNLKWKIKLRFFTDFPFCLPKSKLLNTEFIGIIPHVGKCGTICVEESDTVIIDYEQPAKIVEFYLQQVTELLERAKLKIYQDELLDEYEGYFGDIGSVNSFYCAQERVEHVSLKIMYREKVRQRKIAVPVLLFDKERVLPRSFSNLANTNKLQVINILHLPLLKAVLPPKGGEDISAQYVSDIQSNISEVNQRKLNKKLKKEREHYQFFVLFSMPRSSGERSQLLLHYTANKQLPHPLGKYSDEWNVNTFLLTRHNSEYLLERGGAENILLNKSVVVIGCGSVGGEVAMMLAKSGVGELTLIDKEFLEADNIYRHRLGGASLNFAPNAKSGEVLKRSKVGALGSWLSYEVPFIKVNEKTNYFENILSDKDLLGADVVVVAVGSPTLNLYINKKLKELGKNKVVYCWNEAASYGGHSLAIDLNDNCLECIYTSENGFNKESEIALVKTGQTISKNLTGCAGEFTVFSYLDSSQTAALAAKQTVDFLLQNRHSKAISWKGEDLGILEVTNRYLKMPLKEEVDLNRKEKCRVCNG